MTKDNPQASRRKVPKFWTVSSRIKITEIRNSDYTQNWCCFHSFHGSLQEQPHRLACRRATSTVVITHEQVPRFLANPCSCWVSSLLTNLNDSRIIFAWLCEYCLKTFNHHKSDLLLLIKEILHQLVGSSSVHPMIYSVSYIPGGCLGFLPSQYPTSSAQYCRSLGWFFFNLTSMSRNLWSWILSHVGFRPTTNLLSVSQQTFTDHWLKLYNWWSLRYLSWGMFFQDGLTGSAWGDWANYTDSPLRAEAADFSKDRMRSWKFMAWDILLHVSTS